MKAIGRTVRAVSALSAIVGLLVGVPTVLWIIGGGLLEGRWPSGTVLDILTRPDDGTLLMAFLVAVGAGAWLMLAVSLVSELVAVVTRRPSAQITIPGFRWSSAVAATLVATLVGAGPAMAAPALVADIALVGAAEAESPGRPPPEDTRPVHVVERRDTLWRIAETTLGDPLRWREIYALNADRVQPDGGRLSEASILEVGWRLVLPDDAHRTIRVEPGDTLSELAAEHLGDPALAGQLYDLNTDTPQPDGSALNDPDLIRPGWTLAIPEPITGGSVEEGAPAETALPTTPGRAAPSTTPSADPPPSAADTPEGSEPSATPDPTASAPADQTTPPSAAERPDQAAPPTDGRSAPTQPGPIGTSPVPPAGPTDASHPPGAEPRDDRQQADESPGWAVAAAGMSAIVAGGVIAALTLHRRRQLRYRPFRHRVAAPSDDDGRVEWSLQHPGPAAVGTCSAAAHLDLALRCLTLPGHAAEPVAAIRAVRLTDDDAVITTTGPGALPAPFLPTDDPTVWSLDADATLPVTPDDARGCCAPFPTLVSIGSDGTRTLMIDLEDRGALRIGGDPQRGTALLRHIAAELATSPTAEDTEIIVVGLDEDLPALNPEQIVLMEPAAAIAEVRRRARDAREALRRHGPASVVEGRCRNVAADSWLPTVVLVGQPLDEELRAAMGSLDLQGTAIAIAVLDEEEPNLTVAPDGTLHLDDITDGPWTAVQLTEHAGTHLATLLGTTGEPSEPVEPLDRPESWADDMDEDGGLNGCDDGGSAPEAEPGPPGTEGVEVDPEARRRLAIVDHQDPNLDDDLAIWRSTSTPPVPLVAILGEPAVRAPGPLPRARPLWFVEVLVYLSLHPAGVTPEKAATDLWPDGHRISPATIRHAFYGARRWAGRGLGGNPDGPFVSDLAHDSTYRLRGHLLDWDLFRRLRKRAQARRAAGHDGARGDYEAALSLVRGPVLSTLRPGGYAWINNHDQRHDLQIPGFLVDTAHELVDLALAEGDTTTARRAAERARLVDVDVAFDRPLTDLMRIAHAEDNRSELELYAAVLLDARGFDIPEDLAPDSFAVLNDLLPHGPRKPGA